jgi:hypothetical protein
MPALTRRRSTDAPAGRWDLYHQLPKAEHEAAEWQAAMEALILVATLGGPTMFARIGIMQALNRGHVREFSLLNRDRAIEIIRGKFDFNT